MIEYFTASRVFPGNPLANSECPHLIDEYCCIRLRIKPLIETTEDLAPRASTDTRTPLSNISIEFIIRDSNRTGINNVEVNNPQQGFHLVTNLFDCRTRNDSQFLSIYTK